MADEEELTPEEKLLRVIQKGDSSPPNADLTLGGSAAAPETDVTAESTAIASGIPPSGNGLRTVNRALAAAAVFFLLLAGYETYLNLPANATVYPPETLALGDRSSDVPTTSLGDTLDMFAKRRVFGNAPRVDTPIGPTDAPPLIGWRAYARENLTLMGMSDIKSKLDGIEQTVREAIMMDNKVKKMHFLREGSTLILAEQAVSVSSVGETIVELKRGEEVLKIE